MDHIEQETKRRLEILKKKWMRGGILRTRDKIGYATDLLADPLLSMMSNQALARACGLVTHTLINEADKERRKEGRPRGCDTEAAAAFWAGLEKKARAKGGKTRQEDGKEDAASALERAEDAAARAEREAACLRCFERTVLPLKKAMRGNISVAEGGQEQFFVTITPGLAAEWLEHCNIRNRKMIAGLASAYARDMKEGDWRLSHQGISFDRMGRLADGQHRLEAIRLCGIPQPMSVTVGMDEQSWKCIDRSRKRTFAHNLQMGEKRVGSQSSRIAGIAGHMMRGVCCTTLRNTTDPVMDSFFERHEESLRFAASLPKRIPNLLAAIIARAHFAGAKPDRLARFIDAMDGNVPHKQRRPGDRAAEKLNAWLLAMKARKASIGSGYATNRDSYAKMQEALSLYLRDKEPGEHLNGITRELWPLPSDAPANQAMAGR